jgi:hypothetical protein
VAVGRRALPHDLSAFVDLEAGQLKVLEDEHLLGIVGNGLLKPWRPAGTCR